MLEPGWGFSTHLRSTASYRFSSSEPWEGLGILVRRFGRSSARAEVNCVFLPYSRPAIGAYETQPARNNIQKYLLCLNRGFQGHTQSQGFLVDFDEALLDIGGNDGWPIDGFQAHLPDQGAQEDDVHHAHVA